MSVALLGAIIGIALLDSINPALFLAQFYLLTTPRPAPRILSYIAGILAVNYLGGVLLLAGARALITQLFSSMSGELLYSLGLALGVMLIGFGLWLRVRVPASGDGHKPQSLGLFHAFLLGGAVMLNEITTALPYFIAAERISAAGLSLGENALALLLYNAVFSLPLFGFLVAALAVRERFTAQIERIGHGVQLWSLRIAKYGSIALGALLAADAAAFLGTGAPLWS